MNSMGALSLLFIRNRDGIEVALVGGKKGKNFKLQGIKNYFFWCHSSSGIAAKKTSGVDYNHHLFIPEKRVHKTTNCFWGTPNLSNWETETPKI